MSGLLDQLVDMLMEGWMGGWLDGWVDGGARWLSGKFNAFRPDGNSFEAHSSRHEGTLGKSFALSCASAC